MKSTEYQPRVSRREIAPDDPFDELQGTFYARLRSDLICLMVLTAALACADANPGPIFEDIRVFAHRIRGAAALFGAPDIGIVADALEQAAICAANGGARNTDASVCAALEALTEQLVAVNGRAAPPEPGTRRRVRSRGRSNSF
jgi:HPt (histidine-containing phosphotransfer) domain-containing protein